jgi:hypothetical protein
MPNAMIRHRTAGVLLPLLCTAALACDNESLTNPGEHKLGGTAFEFTLDAGEAGGLPTGSLRIQDFVLIADTAGVADVFGRLAADNYYRLDGTNRRYLMHEGTRHAGTDPRFPALKPLPNPAALATTWLRIMGPEWWKENLWNVYIRWQGMQPGQRYTVALERLGTRVSGAPDHLELLLDGEVENPDELVPLDGQPGGFPAINYNWTTRAACAIKPLLDPLPNPWYLGAGNALASGQLTLDMCWGPPWSWYQNQTHAVPDSSLVMPNAMSRGVVPQYNYVVLYEGEPPNLGPPVLRVQMGVDLDMNGNPLRNAFAPFPLAAERGALVTRPNVQIAPVSMEFDLRNLEPLAGGATYELWLLDAASGTKLAASADYFRVTTLFEENEFGERVAVERPSPDTVRTGGFAGLAATNVRHTFRMANTMLGAERMRNYTHLVLAEPGGSSLDRPALWVNLRGEPVATFRFGAFNAADPAASRRFEVDGAADGSLWDDQLGMQFRRLRRPPPGYFYEVWVVDAAGAARSLGPITTPAPALAPLVDADLSVLENMTETQIIRAAKHLVLEGANAFDLAQYDLIRLTLEAKRGDSAMSPTIILQGPVPEALKKARAP